MKILAIYDNGGETLDRYTVVTNEQWSLNSLAMLGLSDNPTDPQGFSQWSGGTYAEGRGTRNTHLGKRVQFEHLSEELQNHIAHRVFKEGA